jgi:citronellol/citronellal dehydrogenase
MGKLTGKTAIVTGSSRGIGETTAALLAAEGARVACVARTLNEGDHVLTGSLLTTVAAIKQAGGEAMAIAADLTQESECLRVVEEVRKAYGPIDILVNNAGVTWFIPTIDLLSKRWMKAFEVNVHAPFYLSRAVLPDMIARKAGAIINISSGGAIGPGRGPYAPDITAKKGYSLYGATKAALERFTQGLAQEMSQYGGITVAAISPSKRVPTPGSVYQQEKRGWPIDPETLKPENYGEPGEYMARAVLLLVTEPSAKVNGRVTYSQQLLKEYGMIDKASGLGVDAPGSGFSLI